jgi:hypothetical protein
MLKPDKYFNQYDFYFEKVHWSEARKLFRRAIRQYYVMQRRYVIDPSTGLRVKRYQTGAYIMQQKAQRRIVKKIFTGNSRSGRPARPEVNLLVARLFILWSNYAKSPATFSWKKPSAIPTMFEDFVCDLLPRLGASDVRRYVQAHWHAKRSSVYYVGSRRYG